MRVLRSAANHAVALLRPRVQAELIRLALIDWLVSHLSAKHGRLNDYSLEYSTALLMNLCLHAGGRAACARAPDALIRLCIALLKSPNDHVSGNSCAHRQIAFCADSTVH